MNKIKLLSILFFAFLISFVFSEETSTNTVRIDYINALDYPTMRVYASVENNSGEPNLSLVKGNFTAKIDAQDPVKSLNVEPFKYQEEPIHYVFFMSSSGLMDGIPLTAQKEAILNFTSNMSEVDTMSIFIVGETIEELFTYKMSSDIPEDLIQGVTVSETQPKIYDTVVNVARKVEKDRKDNVIPAKDRVIFLLISDGRDSESRFSLEQTQQILNDSGIPLYAIGLKVLSESSLSMLNQIANNTGGYYYYTPRPSGISTNLNLFATQIKMTYVISFKVKGVSADDSFHQLMIQVDDKEHSSQAYRNFMAKKTLVPFWMKIVILILCLLFIAALIMLFILSRIRLRKSLGITKRRCPECNRRMKDDWEFCPFCRYLPVNSKNKKKKKKDQD
jgi:hypothetical protein